VKQKIKKTNQACELKKGVVKHAVKTLFNEFFQFDSDHLQRLSKEIRA
jgi:hypothetical protein